MNTIDANLLENYRISRNLSKEEFCKKCDIDTLIYDKILKREYDFNIVELFKIAKELKLHIKDMFL
ncbi:MAG: hypothetical protein NC132_05715 [Corallococcus sp.]|nr:hypothetical protein [Corallococcus sp.]MCM1360028.1 hypothetical protein [Corallococcus sp.]MCM1395585.1 hypothetical protein [Corallococcus sp.]